MSEFRMLALACVKNETEEEREPITVGPAPSLRPEQAKQFSATQG